MNKDFIKSKKYLEKFVKKFCNENCITYVKKYNPCFSMNGFHWYPSTLNISIRLLLSGLNKQVFYSSLSKELQILIQKSSINIVALAIYPYEQIRNTLRIECFGCIKNMNR